MDTILLHHCCAPCSPEAVRILSLKYKVNSFWFNPNIYPDEEYEKRKSSLIDFTKSTNLSLYFGRECSYDNWIAKAPLTERCFYCYEVRLAETAFTAKKLGIKFFSTTLLSSPYQKHDSIKEIGLKFAKIEGVNFVYHDFREYFYDGKRKAKEKGSYMQKYCGCSYSIEEKLIQQSKKRKDISKNEI